MTATEPSLAPLLVGASGFSYASWKPDFYPAEARPEDFLRLYAERLPTVELNNTFYRLPAEEQFARWAEQTPPGFRFAVTMSRRVTGRGRVEGVDTFETSVRALADRLGPIRIKVPQARDDGFLILLLGSLSRDLRYVLDFRHDSWDEPEVTARLDDARVVRANALDAAAPFRYLRFRDPPYDDAALERIAADVRPLLAAGIEVYGYFRHEDAPTAPAYARRLLDLAAPR